MAGDRFLQKSQHFISYANAVEDNCRDRWVRLRVIPSVSTYALHATSSIKHAVGTRNNPNQKCAELRTIAACKKQKWWASLILFLSKTSRYNLIKAKHSLTQGRMSGGLMGQALLHDHPLLSHSFMKCLKPLSNQNTVLNPSYEEWGPPDSYGINLYPVGSFHPLHLPISSRSFTAHSFMEPVSWSKAQWFSILRRGG